MATVQRGKLGLLAVITPVDTVVRFALLQTGTIANGAETGANHSGHRAMTPFRYGPPSTGADTVAAGTIMAMLMIAVALAWLHGRAPDRARPSWTNQARQATFANHIGVDHSDVDDDRARLAYNAWLARLAEKR